MNSAISATSTCYKAQQGFTLVELITVVILLSIIAISVIPRFTGSTGYTEFTLQKRLLSALRNTQLKAMYDTRAGFCYKMVLNTSANLAFGPSTSTYLSGNQAASCSDSIDFTSDDYLRSNNGEIEASGVSFSAVDNATPFTTLQFDNLGRATTSAGSCANTCTLTFSDENEAKVCIQAEGYVHAC